MNNEERRLALLEYEKWYIYTYKIKPKYIGNIDLYQLLITPFLLGWEKAKENVR